MPERTRLVAGRYRLVDEVGHGGMGVVWRARDEVLHRDVAIKDIHLPRGLTDAEADVSIRRTLREARATAALRHPGIITIHDVVTEDGRPWIVMELIDGPSLAQTIHEDGPLPERRTADVGLQLLRALDAAHAKGILHRDVKPANILLDGDRAVLTDFGIATIDGGTALTGTDQLIGSPEYIAPERIAGREAIPASDLWALGVTLYTAVTGRSPFHRGDRQTTLAAVLTHDPDPLPRANPLRPVVDGLLRKDPAQRLTAERTAALLTKALTASVPKPARVRVDQSVDRLTVPAAAPIVSPARKSRLAMRGVALAGIVLVTGWAIWASSVRVREFPESHGNPGGSASPSPPPPTTTTTTLAVPAGFQAFEVTDAGYRIAVPSTWYDLPKDGYWSESSSFCLWTLCSGGQLLRVQIKVHDLAQQAGALEYLSDLDRGHRKASRGYRQERLEPVASTVAELEYTYPRGMMNDYSLVRAVTRATRVYTIEITASGLQTPPREVLEYWKENEAVIDAILASFALL